MELNKEQKIETDNKLSSSIPKEEMSSTSNATKVLEGEIIDKDNKIANNATEENKSDKIINASTKENDSSKNLNNSEEHSENTENTSLKGNVNSYVNAGKKEIANILQNESKTSEVISKESQKDNSEKEKSVTKEEVVSASEKKIDLSKEEKKEVDNSNTSSNSSNTENKTSSIDTKEVLEDLTYIQRITLEEKIKSEKTKKRIDKNFWKSFFYDFVFIAFCILFTIVLLQKWFLTGEVAIIGTNQQHSSLESGEKTAIGNINVLVMGIDSVEGTHRSDTIFVLGVIPSKNKITMLSIPRDTRVLIEDKGRKINEILPRYGEKVLRKVLEDLLKIRISRKVEVGFESFISVIDAIGGVDINIEKPMHYDDNWGNLHIHFNPGITHLDGKDALRYVRFRKDAMADLGRIKRQQDFVKTVVEKLFSPSCIIKLPKIIESAFKHIKTDFSLQEILTLAKGFNSLKVSFRTLSLPGEPRYIDKISYFLPYSDEAISIGSSYFSDLALFELEAEFNTGKIVKNKKQSHRKK